MAYQSLYRRYRPRRFGEIRGQDHVTRALRNAVRTQSEGHAYLFSGPRGTGKTSTARILAKALNCEAPQDGEPCCECTACQDMEAGRSFDLFELDAASNNGVDAVRDLIERSVVGSPGRTKVYILDEVHMLSTAASNALLKTLEEPPEHVRFVLATTDPQKVLPTIKSRTQHFEFQLLSAQELEDYVRWVVQDAGLDVDDEAVAYVVHQGRGSARDTLSALDQVVAAGGVITRVEPVEALLQALADHDSGAAIVAVAQALSAGHDPRVLGDALLSGLRDVFLVSLGVEVPHVMEADRAALSDWAQRLGTPAVTRAMESVGTALVDMRQAADPRVPLEVALVRLTATGSAGDGVGPGAADAADAGALAELGRRLDRLEAALAGGATPAAPAASSVAEAAAPARPAPPVQDAGGAAPPERRAVAEAPPDDDGQPVPEGVSGPAQARAALGALKAKRQRPGGDAPARPRSSEGAVPPAPPVPRPGAPRPAAAAPPPAEPSTSEPPAAEAPTVEPAAAAPAAPTAATVEAPAAAAPRPGGLDRDALVLAFGDAVVPRLKGMSKALFTAGRFVSVSDDGAVFALENAPTLERAERFRPEVERLLSEHVGQPVRLILVDQKQVGDGGAIPDGPGAAAAPSATSRAREPEDDPSDEDALTIDVTELEDATDVAASGVDKLTAAFPGAVLVDEDEVAR